MSDMAEVLLDYNLVQVLMFDIHKIFYIQDASYHLLEL